MVMLKDNEEGHDHDQIDENHIDHDQILQVANEMPN